MWQLGRSLPLGGLVGIAETKIHDLDVLLLIQQKILWLQIPVHDVHPPIPSIEVERRRALSMGVGRDVLAGGRLEGHRPSWLSWWVKRATPWKF